jgi:hypothetical protein
MQWIIGKDVYPHNVEQEICTSLHTLGYPFVLSSYTDLLVHPCSLSENILYGSLEMYKASKGDLSPYKYSVYSKYIPEDKLMNPVYELVQAKDLHLRADAFVKSDSGSKLFCGEVVHKGKEQERIEYYKRDRLVDTDVLLVCYSVKDIVREYRCVLCKGEVIDMCCYVSTFVSDRMPDVSYSVYDLAEEVGESKSLRDCLGEYFVLDIGQTRDGEVRVLEINCFHTSGLYAMQYRDIFRAVHMCRTGEDRG